MLKKDYELIKYQLNMPMNIYIHSLGYVGRHWHESLELIMVLEGSLEISVNDDHYTLGDGDIILINANDMHDLHAEGAITITLQIDLGKYNILDEDPDNVVFDCNSTTNSRPELFDSIRYAIANMIYENAHHTKGSNLKLYSLSYYLLGELMTHFRGKSSEAARTRGRQQQRMTHIINYINEHYAENFSLSDLAAAEGLSVPYLSSFFEKYLGINFSQYYMSVKLDHAVEDMLKTDDSLETIALRNGFTEIHAFVRAFKKIYQMPPGVWRRTNREADTHRSAGNLNYILLEPTNYLHLLTRYLNIDNAFSSLPVTPEVNIRHIERIRADASASGQTLRHTFKTCVGVGRASDILCGDVQEMLRDVQANIGYSYIKFHGILSDDMMVASRGADGSLHFNYTLIDQVIDFLLSVNLKPLIQLSFMPAALAGDPKKQTFFIPVNTSPPKDMAEWSMLVADFTRHLLARYGEDEVLTWPFCVWNEPMTPGNIFGFDDDKLFFRFYKTTFDAVKQINTRIRFGSPSLLLKGISVDWIRRFLAWTKKNQCFPDFINVHYYSDIIKDPQMNNRMKPMSVFPKEPDDFAHWIDSTLELLRECGAGDMPCYMTEWNFTFSHRNLINDTCFKSCYIMRNLLQNYDRLDSFGYWSLTDRIGENALPDHLFHGGLGMYTMNGLRKSVFYAFDFAAMLGDELLSRGEGYFVTRKKEEIRIITYNYVHYGDLFAAGELFDITETSRYSPFDMSVSIQYDIPLISLENGNYEITEYFVNREHGSVFDVWQNSGAIQMDPSDKELFRGLSAPGFHKERHLVDKGQLSYKPVLEPLEIRFARIRKLLAGSGE